MSSDVPFNRSEEVHRAKQQSDRSDLKQHATKMLRFFEDFNDFSSNRAIWELIQNACDLTLQCHVTIDYRANTFAFTHNGRPFTSNSLISLVKQVSGDKDESSEIPPVGKYGTGFLTTHSLGRKFTIDSLLKSSSGHLISIDKFLVDRSPKNEDELIELIRQQKDRVFELIDRTGKVIDDINRLTTFTYFPETEREIKYVAESYRDLDQYIPIVLTLNNRLKSVKVISIQGDVTHFVLSRKEAIPNEKGLALYQTFIHRNQQESVLYSIAEPVAEIEIVLPITSDLQLFEFHPRVARLFLYYPLIGTENFGINFIINCNKFLPTEPRNGIHLASDRDQTKDEEQANKDYINLASKLLFRFLKE